MADRQPRIIGPTSEWRDGDVITNTHEAELNRLCAAYPEYAIAHAEYIKHSRAKKKGSAVKRDAALKIMQDIKSNELCGDTGFK